MLVRRPCAWPELYLGVDAEGKAIEAAQVYSECKFRQVFGVTHAVYDVLRDALAQHLDGGHDACGERGMTGIESILFGLRKLRTGAATVQFDDQVGFGTSTLDRKFVDFVEHLVAHFKPLYLPGIGSPVLRQVLEDEAEYVCKAGVVQWSCMHACGVCTVERTHASLMLLCLCANHTRAAVCGHATVTSDDAAPRRKVLCTVRSARVCRSHRLLRCALAMPEGEAVAAQRPQDRQDRSFH